MKAMIFAAGLGTRLRPLTNDKPKALVKVNGMPLLEIVIRRLKYHGCREIILNIHHFGDKILDFLKRKRNFDIHIEVSDERDRLLNTGGGLKKAAWFFDDCEPFLVCNTDILTDLDFEKFYQFHGQNNAIATVAVRNRSTSRYLLFNESQELIGWKNEKEALYKWAKKPTELSNYQKMAFSGLHVIHPDFFHYFPEKEDVFSIIPIYLKAAAEQKISAYVHDKTKWLDVGKIPELEKAATIIPDLRLA